MSPPLTLAPSRAPRAQARIRSHVEGGAWTQYYLMEEGQWLAPNVARCPRTAALLRQLRLCDCALGYAYFSILQPGTRLECSRL